jgi:hypothetical protein
MRAGPRETTSFHYTARIAVRPVTRSERTKENATVVMLWRFDSCFDNGRLLK